MSKKVIVFVLLILLIIGGGLGYNYVMTGGARDIVAEEAVFSTTAPNVISEFSANPELATKKYLNQTVEITGKVTAVKGNVISLDEKVSCQFQGAETTTAKSKIKIKGRVTGYDDLFEELKLDQCLIVK